MENRDSATNDIYGWQKENTNKSKKIKLWSSGYDLDACLSNF